MQERSRRIPSPIPLLTPLVFLQLLRLFAQTVVVGSLSFPESQLLMQNNDFFFVEAGDIFTVTGIIEVTYVYIDDCNYVTFDITCSQ
jgi:hypothetical protein